VELSALKIYSSFIIYMFLYRKFHITTWKHSWAARIWYYYKKKSINYNSAKDTAANHVGVFHILGISMEWWPSVYTAMHIEQITLGVTVVKALTRSTKCCYAEYCSTVCFLWQGRQGGEKLACHLGLLLSQHSFDVHWQPRITFTSWGSLCLLSVFGLTTIFTKWIHLARAFTEWRCEGSQCDQKSSSEENVFVF